LYVSIIAFICFKIGFKTEVDSVSNIYPLIENITGTDTGTYNETIIGTDMKFNNELKIEINV
jgi:hypothetical protein